MLSVVANTVHLQRHEKRADAMIRASYVIVCTCVQKRNPGDLIRGLRAQYVASGNAQEDGANMPEAINWVAFARDVAPYFKSAPGLSCMLGPMDAAPKVGIL